VKLGATKPYLSVATYPFPGAFAAIQAVAKRKDTVSLRVPRGGIGTLSKRYAQSVHVAYPDVEYQVEVYDPSPGTATSLVATGQIRAVGGLKLGAAVEAKPTAVTAAGLKSVAGSSDIPSTGSARSLAAPTS